VSHNGESASLSWRLKQKPEVVVVEFAGTLDEHVDFNELSSRLQGSVVFHLEGVRRINSYGAREWVRFLRALTRVGHLKFTHCSPAVVMQMNMIQSFRGSASVESFFAPYECPRCEREENRLLLAIDVPAHDFSRLPTFDCGCGGLLELDDLAEHYLSFLRSS
jgi:anti-anti-sigma regulatory factor